MTTTMPNITRNHGFGEMIIPALQRLVKEGTTFCTWTHEGQA
ncbi:MAG: hypothetical protein ACLU99_14700 [Alphaproteobacteria bacterium]